MIKINYQKQLDDVLADLHGEVPTLLLHACCAPCSSYVLEYLSDYFEITLFYYNPNIAPRAGNTKSAFWRRSGSFPSCLQSTRFQFWKEITTQNASSHSQRVVSRNRRVGSVVLLLRFAFNRARWRQKRAGLTTSLPRFHQSVQKCARAQ